jgi:hypothetical protein
MLNSTLKKIVSEIITFVSTDHKVTNSSDFFDFIDIAEFSERKSIGFSLMFEKNTNTSSDIYSVFQKELNESSYYYGKYGIIFMIEQLNEVYRLTLEHSKLYFKFVDDELQISFNSFYWEKSNEFSFTDALILIKKNIYEQKLYIKQKNDVVSFNLYINNIETYKKIDRVIEY